MKDPTTKQRFLQTIADKYSISIEMLQKIYYGEDHTVDESLRSNIFMEFIQDDPREMFLAMVWKGQSFPGGVTNVHYYEYIGQVMEGLNLRLHRTGYSSQLFPCNLLVADTDYIKRIISKRPGAGFIVLASDNINSLQEANLHYNCPVILLNYPTNSSLKDYFVVSIDDRKSTELLVSHLYELGHRRIACIHGWLGHQSAHGRLDGYYSGLSIHGLNITDDLVIAGNWRDETSYSATKHLLSLPERPSAIIASSDRMAMGAIKAIDDMGLTIPDDVSIAGFGDSAIARKVKPALTTIHMPLTLIGRKASESMIALLEGEAVVPKKQYFQTELIIRESTGKAR